MRINIIINEYTNMVLNLIREFDDYMDNTFQFINIKEGYNLKTGELYKYFTVDIDGGLSFKADKINNAEEFIKMLGKVIPQCMLVEELKSLNPCTTKKYIILRDLEEGEY